MHELIECLNKASQKYYLDGTSDLSDYEYDRLYNELHDLESDTGIVYNNSPTQHVGCEVKNELREVKHTHPMLSLNKCHSVEELKRFAANESCYISSKCDGLTITLEYENGELIKAETRGNGEVGNDVLHNAKTISNIPQRISFKNRFTIDGEVIIGYDVFTRINAKLESQGEDKYRHPRNLAAGSLNLLDSRIAKDRAMRFIAWRMIDGIECDSNMKRLDIADELGFETVPRWEYPNKKSIETILNEVKIRSQDLNIPIDGAVMAIDSIKKGNSLGFTNKFPKHSIAYKYEDELHETILRNIEWNTSKTGLVNPIAIFDPVDLDGAITTRATLHNVSIIKNLQIGIGDTILVRRANGVIPKIEENTTRSDTYVFPETCPSCGEKLMLAKENDSEVLMCVNEDCPSRLLAKLTHFCSRNAMDIESLSESTLEKFMNLGWIKNFYDIYQLKEHKEEMKRLPGFGSKKVDKILDGIEASRHVSLERFINALSIHGIGQKQSKTLKNYFENDYRALIRAFEENFDFSKLEGFGKSQKTRLFQWYKTRYLADKIQVLSELMIFENPQNQSENHTLLGKKIAITGKLETFPNRETLIEKVESCGGIVVNGVNSKTNYLVNNDVNSCSSKNTKAKQSGVAIVTELQLIEMMGGSHED